MIERGEDRRIARTKRRLKLALLELIEERDYDAITIRDLTDRADVGRSTFYSHFGSKEDLLFAGFDRWILTIGDDPDSGRPGPAGFRFSLPLLRHIRDQERFFRAIIVRAGNPRIRRRVTALLAERVRLELGPDTAAGPRSSAARAQAVVGAFLGLVTWWLDEGREMSAEDVDRLFQDVVGGRAVRWLNGAAG